MLSRCLLLVVVVVACDSHSWEDQSFLLTAALLGNYVKCGKFTDTPSYPRSITFYSQGQIFRWPKLRRPFHYRITVIISKENRKSKIPSQPVPDFVIILPYSGAHMQVWRGISEPRQVKHLICGCATIKMLNETFPIKEFSAHRHWNNIEY